MKFYIVIPAHNEAAYLGAAVKSLMNQSLPPKALVVVNDNSTDDTQKIINELVEEFPTIRSVSTQNSSTHLPGAKIVNAFYEGFQLLDDQYDVLCKFDADLIFPEDYLQQIADCFQSNSKCGMAGGHCYIEKNGHWVLENLTGKDHIRGALKAYRKKCFEQIGGLKSAMGWDTIDELLAKYHGWKVTTLDHLRVKHLKPTGANYSKASGKKQGTAFKSMRYGLILTLIASAKLAFRKRSLSFFLNCLSGYLGAKGNYLVSEPEGKFIRKLRWTNIRKKLF